MKDTSTCSLSRRTFLKHSMLGFAGLAATPNLASATFPATFDTSSQLEKHIIPLPVSKRHKLLHGLRIGVLTDIHHGLSFEISLLRQSLEYFAAQHVDLLLLVGDYIWLADSYLSYYFPVIRDKRIAALPFEEQAGAALADIRKLLDEFRFRHQALAVYGNHDHWSAQRETEEFLRGPSVRLLKNETQKISLRGTSMEIFGADDYWTGRPRLSAFSPSKQNSAFRILLAHNPDYASYVQSRADALFDLAVCGHTHGGQVKLPFLGAVKHNIEDSRFLEGLSFAGSFPVYTSRGLGSVEIPYRINCPPEAGILELVA